MDKYTIAVALLVLIITSLIAGSVLNHRKLKSFRGPPLASFSELRRGSPVRIGPNLLIHNDPDVLRHLLAPGSGWRRSEWYEGMKLDPRVDTVFSTRDERLHTEMKAKEAGGYNGRDFTTMESDVDARIVDLVGLIRDRYTGTIIDLADVMRFFTLDVLSTLAFGRPFGFMAANKDLWDYGKTNAEFMPIFQLQANHGWMRRILSSPVMQALAAPKVTDATGIGPALGFARQAVAERYGPEAKTKQDMLGHFVGKGLTQTQCEAEANLQIIAGSDSTTTVLRCTLFLLIANPTTYGKLRADIDSCGFDGSASITYSTAQSLPYLSACIWEGLRMYPPLFGLLTKLAPPGGDTVNGVYIPGGTGLAVCYASMCRRKDIFGQDSHLYRPERWIEAAPKQKRLYHNTVEAVFGTGRFQCLGKHIAMVELHKTIAELIRRFDWSIADPMMGVYTRTDAVHIHRNMNVVARARDWRSDRGLLV
ncbi:hypothetical protein LTR53_014273 [Teratosphaeriaceae sp. CCFEE 6253]|nr:hypothetical protein LTR53_014273 [Teratosphaeriaceae sp. CCFEE 6253]